MVHWHWTVKSNKNKRLFCAEPRPPWPSHFIPPGALLCYFNSIHKLGIPNFFFSVASSVTADKKSLPLLQQRKRLCVFVSLHSLFNDPSPLLATKVTCTNQSVVYLSSTYSPTFTQSISQVLVERGSGSPRGV